MQRLAEYPEWKLLRTDEYRIPDYGMPTLASMCKYLDDLTMGSEQQSVREALGYEPKTLRQLPEPKDCYGKMMLKHCIGVAEFEGTKEERHAWEKESLLRIEKMYPGKGAARVIADRGL